MTVEPTPMNSDSRPPYQIIEKMSRPIVSVPNRNSRHGTGRAVSKVEIRRVLRHDKLAEKTPEHDER